MSKKIFSQFNFGVLRSLAKIFSQQKFLDLGYFNDMKIKHVVSLLYFCSHFAPYIYCVHWSIQRKCFGEKLQCLIQNIQKYVVDPREHTLELFSWNIQSDECSVCNFKDWTIQLHYVPTD